MGGDEPWSWGQLTFPDQWVPNPKGRCPAVAQSRWDKFRDARNLHWNVGELLSPLDDFQPRLDNGEGFGAWALEDASEFSEKEGDAQARQRERQRVRNQGVCGIRGCRAAWGVGICGEPAD